VQSRTVAEAHGGEVQQPPSALAPVHAKCFQARLKVVSERCRCTGGVAEHEHPHTLRLAVPVDRELDRGGFPGGGLQSRDDAFELTSGPGAEKGQGDVQVLARHDTQHLLVCRLAQLELLPGDDGVEDVRREPEGEKETKPFIAPHATG